MQIYMKILLKVAGIFEGLYYCHARWYDADIGCFLQADSILDGFNRYVYCHNNPIRFVDPTGREQAFV